MSLRYFIILRCWVYFWYFCDSFLVALVGIFIETLGLEGVLGQMIMTTDGKSGW